jgi:PAS domain S-box-containing protein
MKQLRKQAKDTARFFREDHELFTKLISAIPDAVTLTDRQGKIIFVNDVALKLGGYTSAKQIIGKDVFSFILPQEKKKAKVNLAGLLKRRISPNEYTLVTKDGRHVPLEIHGSVLRNADGAFFARIHICRDITERKRAIEGIVKSEQRYRAILDKAPDAVFIRDKSGNIVDTNRQAIKLLGYSRKELIGQHVSKIYPPEELKKIKKVIERTNRVGRARIDDTCVLRKNGRKVNVDASGSCFTSGNEVLYKITIRDMTEQRKMQEQLKKAKSELEAQVAERTMELMASNTALKVLLSNIDRKKTERDGELMMSLQAQISPHIQALNEGNLSASQQVHVTLIEKSIQNITAQFTTRTLPDVTRLTPKEIQVAGLVREGMATKDIAKLMHLSRKTVDIFRGNVRKKMGLKGHKVSLRSHLLAL